MPIRTILFLVGLGTCTVGGLFNPLYGIIGYVCHYLTWPEMQWWGDVLNPWGIRYSMLFAVITMIGMLLNAPRLRWGRSPITGQEFLVLLFLISAFITDAVARSNTQLNPWQDSTGLLFKLAKIILFTFLLTHVITVVSRFRTFVWVLVLGSLYLGIEAYNAPEWMFQSTRIDHVGGPDFAESSFFGAHLVAMLPFIGIFFLCGNVRMKLVALAAGGFTVNALVLTRTRAAFVGLLVALVFAFVLKIRRKKLRMVLYLVPAAVLAFTLTDTGFWLRMETILAPPQQLEQSAAGRLDIWRSAWRVLQDYPFGTGAGSFAHIVGHYDKTIALRDAHNVFIRCAVEFGVHSACLLLVIIINGWFTIRRAWKNARGTPHEQEIHYYCYALAVCQAGYLAASMFMTTLFIEEFWWFLMLPVCLDRCADNARTVTVSVPPVQEIELSQSGLDEWMPPLPNPGRGTA